MDEVRWICAYITRTSRTSRVHHVHHAYITYITRTSRTSRVHRVHRGYIACTLCAHCMYIACTSLVDVKGVVGHRCGGGGARESGKSERWSGGMAESERGKVERSGNVGKRSSHKGVPLTITPPLEKHRPDAWVGREIGRKGIEPKAIVRIRRGAAGLRW